VRFRAYAASAARIRDVVTAAGADVLLSNHTDYDGTKTKLPALAARKPGAAHPYVVGTDSVRRYLTVANECAQAALASVAAPVASASPIYKVRGGKMHEIEAMGFLAPYQSKTGWE